MIIAVDFDGTLVTNAYPNIGKIKRKTFKLVKQLQADGHQLILWTCRANQDLQAAVDFCKSNGLEFDAINANTREQLELFPNDCRKVYADVYIDDKALNINSFSSKNVIKWANKIV